MTPEHTHIHDLIIIGSGPAGYTAALYAARADLAPLVFEGTQFGGALMSTTDVENYPGFPDGVLGPELMERMRTQASRFGADLRTEDVDALDLAGATKTVITHGRAHHARAIILTTGATPRYLGIPGEQRLLGHGVSTCATCDGFFFRNHDIAVVGGGDSAMEEATFLTRFARTVTLIHRRETFRASPIMLDRARTHHTIHWHTNTTVTDILGDTSVTGLRVRDTVTDDTSSLDVAALFIAIGHDPRNELVHGALATDDGGHLRVHRPSTHTDVDGVFAAGDLVDHTYRQAATAVGTGCQAALDAQRWLTHHTDPRTAAPSATAPLSTKT